MMAASKKTTKRTKKSSEATKLNFSKKAISKTSLVIVALVCGLFGAFIYFMSSAATACNIGNNKGFEPYYRLYKPSTGDHFYTTSTSERDKAVKSYGYRNEGIAACVAKQYLSSNGTSFGCTQYAAGLGTGVSLTPLYKSFNKSVGDHFYTTSSQEVKLSAQYGYKYEGVSTCVIQPIKVLNSKTQASTTTCTNDVLKLGGDTLKRSYNPYTSDHFYTASSAEHATAIKKYGYKNEGITACVLNPR